MYCIIPSDFLGLLWEIQASFIFNKDEEGKILLSEELVKTGIIPSKAFHWLERPLLDSRNHS